jgi:hypothetical protein
MKTLSKTIALVLGLGLMTVACQPEQTVEPKGSNPDTGLELAHARPTPECTGMHYSAFADASGNTEGGYPWPTAYGQVELANDPDNVFVITSLGGGWVMQKCDVNAITSADVQAAGAAGAQILSGSTENWDASYTLNPCPQAWTAIIPMDKSSDPCLDIVVRATIAQVSLNGDMFNQTEVWVQGESTVDGKPAYDFCFVQCGTPEPPACVIPTTMSRESLQATTIYDCSSGNGQRKVTVCHVPPGNPENMHEICIPLDNADAHIISMKPVDQPCMGHHSGCHIGSCDPCGAGSTLQQSVNIPVVSEYGTKYACPGN